MLKEINRCFMRLEDRAERVTTKQIADTFVQVGPLIDLLESKNNQIIYGRRGTGKTHALRYFQSLKNHDSDIAIYIDAQNIGSNGSIYNDTSLPIGERATRLLVDVCSAIHHELLDIFTSPGSDWDLSEILPVLDRFSYSFTETRVSGQVETGYENESSRDSTFGMQLNANLNGGVSGTIESSKKATSNVKISKQESGQEESWIDFNWRSQVPSATLLKGARSADGFL